MSTHPAATSLLTPIPSPAFPTHRRSGMTLSMHYFTSSVLWSLALIALLAGWYAVEKWGFHLKGTPMRMVADPTEFGVRIMGIAHFVIAAIFLATSPRLRMAGGWLWLLGLSAAAVLLCWAFSAAGGRQNPIALILFYMFFFIHAFRDEAYFYRIRAGKAVPPEQHTEAVLRWLQVVALCALLALLVSVISVRYSLGFVSVQENALRSLFPASWPFVMVFFATVAPLVVLATIAFARISGQQPGGFAGLVRTHRPLVGVIGGTMAILLASMLLGAWTYNLVILMHFVAWFEYSTVRIRALPRAMRQRSSMRRPLDWTKTSLTGFCVLHIGLSVLALAMIACNHYWLKREPIQYAGTAHVNPFELLFSAQNLYYWTIAHVALSFFPRPAPRPA